MTDQNSIAPPAHPAMPMTRRGLIGLAAGSAALAAAPLAARGFGTGFTHGVASGEPGPGEVLLWTRYAAGHDVKLIWQVGVDPDFAQIVAEGEVIASPDNDCCAKPWARGLQPGRWYYYRFIAPDGSLSDVGRTRTLPDGAAGRFRMAVFSCSNYGFGWFNAYAHAALANDADLALHLGDYLYEYGRGTYPTPDAALPHRALWPQDEIVALADYRLRYATYRSDPDLRRIHQMLPMICIWDDHESANDSWAGGAENHQSATEGDWQARKEAAKRVYREWMPVSDRPYAKYEIGDLATLFRLDTRLEGRDRQFDLGTILAGKQSPEEALAALNAFRHGDYLRPDRQMLGPGQEAWLYDGLKASRRGGKIWQVLVQQVIMGQLAAPAAMLDGLAQQAPEYTRQQIRAGALASRAGLPINMDAWDGYPAARERLLQASLEADANLLVLAGDSHNAWAFDLDHAGQATGIEFGIQSVTSPGLETYLGAARPGDVERGLVGHNPALKWADASRRGYAMVELTDAMARAEYRFIGNIRSREPKLIGTHQLASRAGTRRLMA